MQTLRKAGRNISEVQANIGAALGTQAQSGFIMQKLELDPFVSRCSLKDLVYYSRIVQRTLIFSITSSLESESTKSNALCYVSQRVSVLQLDYDRTDSFGLDICGRQW